jgi:hypothetical protein
MSDHFSPKRARRNESSPSSAGITPSASPGGGGGGGGGDDHEKEKRLLQDLNNRLELYVLWLREKDAEVKNFEELVHKLQKERQDDKEKARELGDELARLRALNKSLLDSKLKYEELKAEIGPLRERLTELKAENDNLRDENAGLKDENARLRGEVDRLQDAINGLRDELKNLETKHDKLKADKAALEDERDNLKDLLKQLQDDIKKQDLDEITKRYLKKINDLKSELEKKDIELRREYGQQVAEAAKEVQNKYLTIIKKLEDEIKDLKEQLLRASDPNNFADKLRELENLRAKFEALKSKYAHLKLDFDQEKKRQAEHEKLQSAAFENLRKDGEDYRALADQRRIDLEKAKARIADLLNLPKPIPETKIEYRAAPCKSFDPELKVYELLVESEEDRNEPKGYFSPRPRVPFAGIELEILPQQNSVVIRNTSDTLKDFSGWSLVNRTTNHKTVFGHTLLLPAGRFISVVFGSVQGVEPQGYAKQIVEKDVSLTAEDEFTLVPPGGGGSPSTSPSGASAPRGIYRAGGKVLQPSFSE